MKNIWLIDDDNEHAERIAYAASNKGLKITIVPPNAENLPEEEPDLVLLDYSLDVSEVRAESMRNNWVQTLSEIYPLAKICLLTFFPGAAEKLARTKNLAGVLTKPLVFDELEKILNKPNLSIRYDVASSFPAWFNAVETPIYIVNQEVKLITQNNAACEQAIFSSNDVGAGLADGHWNIILQKLMAELRLADRKIKYVCKWDWNVEKNQWEEWRLHRLRDAILNDNGETNDEYWLSRTLHATISPLNAAPLSAKLHLKEYLDELADLMREQWGITRLRLYMAEAIVGELKRDTKKGWRITPLAATGHHFSEDGKSWLCNELNLDETNNAEELRDAMPGTVLLFPTPVAEAQSSKLSSIPWGNAKTRVKMMIGEVLPSGEKAFVGQLSFDRRTDHLLPEEALPIAWGDISGNDVVGMQGFLKIVHDDLLMRLKQRQGIRMMSWQKTISDILTEGVSDAGAPTTDAPLEHARKIICTAFDKLLLNWNLLQNAPWEERKPQEFANETPVCVKPDTELLELYVAEGISNQLLRCEIGAEKSIFKIRSYRNSPWHIRWPFSGAWWAMDYEAFVIQDFKAEKHVQDGAIELLLDSYQKREVPEEIFKPADEQYHQVGSWVGIKIPRDKDRHWILITMARGKNVWTSGRIDWLHALAKRLATLLRWWNAETEREWFRYALAHELRKPMQLLEGDIANWLEIWPENKDKRSVSKGKVKDLYALVKLHGHMIEDIQKITGVRFGKEEPEVSKTCTLLELNQSVDWLLTYHKGEVVINNSCDDVDVLLSVPQKAMAHIYINVLLNAIKFNPEIIGEKVKINLILNDVRDVLLISILNAVFKPIPEEKKAEILLPYVKGDVDQIGTTEGMGAGLAVVDALCKRHGVKLTISDEKGKGEWHWQIFTLAIPAKTEGNHE
ncbi:ATP-binding protein [Massilia sp. W12]|uniref:ATP-binding protein n=1 Tax=Massilia sp. W12 TaxID=3126507 RepID=UPI0030D4D452